LTTPVAIVKAPVEDPDGIDTDAGTVADEVFEVSVATTPLGPAWP